uniref:Co/Zn/Cd efflux system membrane fusion protein n=1 Tax=uncultured Armatimonadetes bacterium TaxID=157466 RepID=A0A6J4IWK7_9BACT|nr:hypothetical protein AVDCRST_MAG63-2471 [uncultured Armatimonadetes bacterium]
MKRWVYILFSVVVLASLIGWRLSQKRAEAAKSEAAGNAMRNAPALVETAALKRQDIVKTFEAVGSVEAPLAVDVTPKVTGRILYLGVREGDRVTAGQVLVNIDPAEVQAEVLQRRAALAGARSRLAEAALTRNAQSVGVASTVRQQQAALGTARAQNRKAKADYDAQIAAAQAAVTDAQGRVAGAQADVGAADAAIASAEANVANAKTELERQESLLADGATSKQVVDNVRTTLKVQEAALGQARQGRGAAVAALASARAQKQAAERQVLLARNRARSEVFATNSNIKQVEATLDAARANVAQTPAFAQNLAALRAAVSAAEAELAAAQSRLSDTTLRAPITGVVTQRAVDTGALASPGQPILSIQAVQQVWAAVSLPEEVSRRIYQGQNASVTFDALPGETFAGRIVQIFPTADAQSRQFTARVRLDNRRNRVRPGMFGRVTFVTEKANDVLVVPLEAVKTDPATPGAGTVTVVADGKAQTRPVQTGLSNGKVIALKSGVTDGEQVIILSTRPVREGQAVRAGGGGRRGGGGAAGGNNTGGGDNAAAPARGGSAR